MNSWDEACAYALSLPDVEMASWWGNPCPKVNGKGFMSPATKPEASHSA